MIAKMAKRTIITVQAPVPMSHRSKLRKRRNCNSRPRNKVNTQRKDGIEILKEAMSMNIIMQLLKGVSQQKALAIKVQTKLVNRNKKCLQPSSTHQT